MADGGTIEAEAMAPPGLLHVSDDGPGITRRRCGRGFAYYRNGELVRDQRTLARIRALAIPPAYRDVWISPLPHGHIQATGRDERGRKQYRYHDDFRAHREQTKFDRLPLFGAALPGLRERIDADLRRRKLSREKVLATAVRLLERTLIRVGNRSYARENRSVGLTTLRHRHLDVNGEALRLVFRGKGGKPYRLKLRDRRVANALRRLDDLDGQHLFQWEEDGTLREVTSTDVNAYIRENTGEAFTAKYFRTWGATVLMARALSGVPAEFASEAEANRNVVAAVDEVAAVLGNTRTVCRQSYIHPVLEEAYLAGRLQGRIKDCEGLPFTDHGLSSLEASTLALIRDEAPA